MQFTLGKNEKLKSRKAISQLFTSGDSVKSFPIKMIYEISEEEYPCKIKAAFSVPKRKFKHAVDRNRIKRLMRECYRLNKHEFFIEGKSYNVMFIYMGHKETKFQELEKKFLSLKDKFHTKEIEAKTT